MNQLDPLLQPSKTLSNPRQSHSCLPIKYRVPVIVGTILVVCGVVAFCLTTIFCEFADCDSEFQEERPAVLKTTSLNHSKPKVSPSSCGKRVVGYFNGWGSREITYNMFSKLTHAIYAVVALDSEGTLSFGSVENRRCFLDAQNNARYSNTGVKLMVSIGGNHYSQYFSGVAKNKRENFINSTISFIKTYQIDGVDIYWHEPNTDGSDNENYVLLVEGLRKKLTHLQKSQNRSAPYLLTVLTPSFGWYLEDGVDLKGLSEHVDFFNIASDDYTEEWSSSLGVFTKPHAPLYAGSGGKFKHKVD